MITVTNNKIIVSKLDDSYNFIKSKFIAKKYVKTPHYKGYKYFPLYEVGKSGDIVLPRGYLKYIKYSVDGNIELREDTSLSDIVDSAREDNKIDPKMSEIVTLRSDQLYMIEQMLSHKRGIIQAATGSGKSEVMSGFLRYMNDILGYYPTTLVLEPTLILVDSIIDRFSKYGIETYRYDDIRESGEFPTSGVVVAHPSSIYNDIESGAMCLNNAKILLADECQHLASHTWSTIFRTMDHVQYSIGVSAKAVLGDFTDISRYDLESATIIGATGDVLVDIDANYYISQGVLSVPILLKVMHDATDPISEKYSWHSVVRSRLHSTSRSRKIASMSSLFESHGYKTLVLCNTKAHAKTIANILYEQFNIVPLLSFGQKEFLEPVEYDKFSKYDSDDPMMDFETGKVKVLIGTTHLYEGVDIPNLDAVVLASVGKSIRRVIQAVGRAVRISKTGNFAYIVDFSDTGDPILSKHSKSRLKTLKDEIGVSTDTSYAGDVSNLSSIFRSLEHLE